MYMSEFFLGDRLKAAIKAAGTNQSALAKAMGVKVQSVQQCADGRACFGDDTMGRAANALDVSVGWLARGERTENPSEIEIAAIISLAMPIMTHEQRKATLALTEALIGNSINHRQGRDKS